MSSPQRPVAHVAVYDTLADWEPGHLLAELRTGRFTGQPFEVRAVGPTATAITTMGGLRITPDLAVEDLDPETGSLLVLPGAELWDDGGGQPFTELARQTLAAGIPVAAICGATFGLARDGLLDDRPHTSAAAEYLAASGYAGAAHYVDERAVAAGGLITAGPDSPVQFAAETLVALGLIEEDVRAAYEGVFGDGDAAAYPALMQAAERLA